MARQRAPRRPKDARLGAFLGVFTPTILTILGVILYLRLGWVAGQAGLARTLLIVALANSITLITVLSISAIATNIRVGVGGAYYIISRSLGLEVGGAIGLPLFLSQVFSVTLYAFGLAESVRILWPGAPVPAAAILVILCVGALAFRGAGLALKAQLPLMTLIAISIAALAVGASRASVTALEVAAPAPTPALGFWVVFAVFFPAVTGIMAGLGLSGDLRDPVKAIPRGTLAATLVGFVIYLGIPFLLSRAATPEALRQDPLVWTRIAPLGAWLILPGLWGAIFSSAVGAALAAPRTLQALARDHLAPAPLARLDEIRKQPAAGLGLTLGIALAAVLLGGLNAVAPVVTIFFLTVYGIVNLVAALETLSGDPSWRPRLRVPWPVSLVGGVACFTVMFLISPLAAVAAIAVEIALWLFLARRQRQAGWGDVRRGVYESLIRWSLIRLARRPMTARNWRPHVLVFVDDVERRLDLIRFGTWFSQERGVVTVCELVVGDLAVDAIEIEAKQERIQRTLKREKLAAFGEVDVIRDVISGIVDVSQANGMAGLDSNTILVGWPRESSRLVELLQVVGKLERLHKSAIIGKIQPGLIPRAGEERVIHVWWGGLQRNSDLMLLLAYLLTRNPEWRDSRIRIMSLASNELMKERTERSLEELLAEIRIAAEQSVMLLPKDRKVLDVIHDESAEADLVLLGLNMPKREDQAAYAERLFEIAAPLRTVFFVKNSSLFVGKLIESADTVSEEEAHEADAAAGGA